VVRRALTGHVTEEMQRGVLNLMPAREILTINDEKPKVDLQVVGGGSALRLLRFAGSGQGERKARTGRVSAETSDDRLERDNGFEPSTFSLGS
jgi:hypothetical protein